jgi:hypothetical protein
MTTARDLAGVNTDEPESESGMTRLVDDPILAAIEAAPFVPATDEENALLDEIERTTRRWIPHDEFVAALGTANDR